MTEQTCPACGCHIGVSPYEKEDVIYCCQACAEGRKCECGCCEITDKPEAEK